MSATREHLAYEVYLALPDAALDALTYQEEHAARAAIAAALAEARAPYDRLTAAVRALAEELDGEGVDPALPSVSTYDLGYADARVNAAARIRRALDGEPQP